MALTHLSSVADLLEKDLESLIDLNEERTALLTNRTQLRKSLRAYLDGDATQKTTMNIILSDAREAVPSYREILITDLEGNLIASSENYQHASSGMLMTLLRSASTTENRIVIIPNAKERAGLVSVRPLLLDGLPAGILALITSPDELIAIVTDTTGLGETGEAGVAMHANESQILTINPLRFDSNASFRRLTSRDDDRFPIVRAMRGEEKSFTDTVDYRGQRVFAATRFIPELEIGLVVKIDRNEAMVPLGKIVTLLLLFGLLTLFVTPLFTGIGSTFISAPLQLLSEAAKKMQAGNLSVRTLIRSHDEIGQLSTTFNDMADKLGHYTQRLQEEVRLKTKDLEQGNLRLRQLVGEFPDGLLIVDEHRMIINVNRQLLKLFSIDADPASLVGHSAWELKQKLAQQMTVPHLFLDRIEMIVGANEPVIAEELAFADGRIFTRDYIPLSHEGRSIGHVWMYRDVTRERRLDAVKTEFISLVAHQLRSPLTAMRWGISSLRAESPQTLNDQQRLILDATAKGASRMSSIIHTMLMLTKIDSSSVPIDSTTFVIKPVLEDVCSLCDQEIKERGHSLSLVCSPTLSLKTDEQIFREILFCLIDNAIRYTPNGGKIHITVEDSGNEILVRVADNGYGIPAHEQPKLFQKFFRGTRMSSLEPNGTGLGLYIVYNLILLLHGQVGVTSDMDRGTTVTISFSHSV